MITQQNTITLVIFRLYLSSIVKHVQYSIAVYLYEFFSFVLDVISRHIVCLLLYQGINVSMVGFYKHIFI